MTEPKPPGLADDERWQFEIKFRNLGDKNAFMRANNEANQTGDVTPLYAWLARFVKAWPLVQEEYETAVGVGEPLNPSLEADYERLTIAQWEETVQRLTVALATFRR